MSPASAGGLGKFVDELGADLAAAIEQIAFPISIVDTKGVVRWVNEASIALVGDIVGLPYADLIAPEVAPKVKREFAAKMLGTRGRSEYELVLLDREGARVHLEVATVALTAGEKVVGVLGVGYPSGRVVLDGDPADRLTPRQREVLRLLAQGRSTREIADELALSQETVRNHVRHVLRRLRARSRLEAVLEARRLGIR
jgi:PAS domain S-box-containing protein